MSVFFENKVESLSSSTDNILFSSWSTGTNQAVLAVARSNAEVVLLDQDGLNHGDHALISNGDNDCTALAWHPNALLLALGWEDGGLALCDTNSSIKDIDHHLHKGDRIVILNWSPQGNRLISGDESGTVFVSEATLRNGIRKLCRFSDSSAFFKCIFLTAPIDRKSLEGSVHKCPKMIYGGASGNMMIGDDIGHCQTMASTQKPIKALFYSFEDQSVVVVSSDAVLFVFSIQRDGTLAETKKFKLSIQGDGSDLVLDWSSHGLLIAANKEIFVRLWHIATDENYVLPISDPRHMAKAKDTIDTISYNPRKRMMAGGTAMGRIVMWKYAPRGNEPSELDWQVLPPVNLSWEEPVCSLSWGDGHVSASWAHGLSLLNETVLHCKRFNDIAVLQMSTEKLIVHLPGGKIRKLNSTIRVKGISIGEKLIVLWSGRKVEVHEIVEGNIKYTSGFASQTTCCALHKQTIYACVDSNVESYNLQGTTKKVLAMSEREGRAIFVDAAGDFLTAATSEGYLKLWDVSRREPKALVPGRNIFGSLPNEPGNVRGHGYMFNTAKVNRTGSHICITYSVIDTSDCHLPSAVLLLYDVETDRVLHFDFTGRSQVPTNCIWDEFDARLLVVYTRSNTAVLDGEDGSESPHQERGSPVPEGQSGITTFFVTSEYGVLEQDHFACGNDVLIGSEVPFTYFVKGQGNRPDARAGGLPHVQKRVMRDFMGLDDVDEDAKANLMKFSFHVAAGNMDEAFAAVKNIESQSIWQNMARMCVITRRLDVAPICLGHMGSARGAAALREAAKQPEKEVQLAAIAIELGMLHDAAQLYRECKRFDLLAKLHCSTGEWQKAIDVCEQNDRIHLKTTRFLLAQHYEKKGALKKALVEYEKSDSHFKEVPRMLYEAGALQDLELYVKKERHPKLLTWWARYCESIGDLKEALELYKEAKEHFSVVRLLCFSDDIEAARQVCDESGDLAACYHVGRHLEEEGNVDEAITMLTKAKRLKHALRLAKEHEIDSAVLTLSLDCPPALQLDAARYFEKKGNFDKAVTLYHRGGDVGKALELCFRTRQFDSLQMLTDDLGEDTDPEVLSRCASFFLENEQYGKAARLFVIGRQYHKALAMCLDHGVTITDDLAEKLTPPKPKAKDPSPIMSKEGRVEHLRKLAALLHEQGSFHLATKKYTQAGDKVMAMKSLLKSNDTNKIIYYATMTKKREVYIIAANYLQNMDWHSDQDITKAIITFYTKAKAPESLSLFYSACAQVEIDEYRDYEKAAEALRESLKILSQGMSADDPKVVELDRRLTIVEKFVEARHFAKTDPEEMERLCLDILAQDNIEVAIRAGDVYAILIEYYYSQERHERAHEMVQAMCDQGIELSPYINADILAGIQNATGMHPANDDENEDEVEDFDADEEI